MGTKAILTLSTIVMLLSCEPSADKKAAPMMQRIDSLYALRQYPQTLNTIRELRAKHPKAVESRKRALKIWQEASLKMTQADIAKTDSALQATIDRCNNATTIAERNQLAAKRDSLQIRYDALCGTVRVIHRRQKE